MAYMVQENTNGHISKFFNYTSNNNDNAKNNTSLLEAFARGGCITSQTTEDGKVKIKVLVKKQDLKLMLQTLDVTNDDNVVNAPIISQGKSSAPSSTSSSIEMRLYELMKRKKANQAKKEHQFSNYWRPALQSIPE